MMIPIFEKKYCDYMDEITPDELYEGLLGYGLFADKLPPIFTALPFYEYCQSMNGDFSRGSNDYISFRVMRNTDIPRTMGIPVPMRYHELCVALRDNWGNIQKHFHQQTDLQSYKISRIHIRKENGNKALFKMSYKNWKEDGNPETNLLVNDRGIGRFLVKADISTCFPSIYTHSISWALVGKEMAKSTKNTHGNWYNDIDAKCSNMRSGETHGLLIGPHASNLLSEILLTVVDRRLYEIGYRFIRNIDDYDCYVDSFEKAQLFLCDLEKTLLEYDLPLNHKKTRIIELPVGIEENWKYQLSVLPSIGEHGVIEYPQVNYYIDMAIRLANESNNYAIIKYAIKTLSGAKLSLNAKQLAGKRFMHIAVLHPYLLHLMEEYVFGQYDTDSAEIKLLSDTIYRNAKSVKDYESICYVLYFAIRYDFVLAAFDGDEFEKTMKEVIDTRDCIVLLMAWLYLMKRNHWNRRASQIKPLIQIAKELANTDMDRYWLFCYEVLTSGNLRGDWKKMKQNEVGFIRWEDIGRDSSFR